MKLSRNVLHWPKEGRWYLTLLKWRRLQHSESSKGFNNYPLYGCFNALNVSLGLKGKRFLIRCLALLRLFERNPLRRCISHESSATQSRVKLRPKASILIIKNTFYLLQNVYVNVNILSVMIGDLVKCGSISIIFHSNTQWNHLNVYHKSWK